MCRSKFLEALKKIFLFYQETILYQQSKRRRIAMTEGPNYRPPGYPKCIHSESNVKCNSRAMPLSKFCNERIL